MIDAALTGTDELSLADVLRKVGEIVASLDETDKLLNTLMGLVTRAMRVDRCSLMLIDPRTEELRIRAAHHLAPDVIRTYRARPGEGIAGWVAQHGRPLLIKDLDESPFAGGGGSVNYKNRSLLSVPLKYRGNVIGVLNVNNKLDDRVFSEEDEGVLTAVAHFVVSILERAKLRGLAEQKRKIDADLELAQATQDAFIPDALPCWDDLELAAYRRSAGKVAGDFHDVLAIGGDGTSLIVGDVCGKGLASALYMARVMGYFRAAADMHDSPNGVLAAVNRLVAGESTAFAFVTACLVSVSPDRSALSLYNAGHLAPYLFNERTGMLRVVKSGRGYPLGVDAKSLYNRDTLTLSRGDNLVLYTDGITEAANAGGEQFGTDRLEDTLIAHKGPAADMVERIVSAVGDFTPGQPRTDDQTVLVLRKP